MFDKSGLVGSTTLTGASVCRSGATGATSRSELGMCPSLSKGQSIGHVTRAEDRSAEVSITIASSEMVTGERILTGGDAFDAVDEEGLDLCLVGDCFLGGFFFQIRWGGPRKDRGLGIRRREKRQRTTENDVTFCPLLSLSFAI